jgi:mono/diheme cytochrome c family protein
MVLSGGPAVAADAVGDARYGLKIAQRYCGGCHAVAGGSSPLFDAPPFRNIYKRYRKGGLSELLREGMLQPSELPQEGTQRLHPRMPMAVLGDDEVKALTAYLRGLEPHRR